MMNRCFCILCFIITFASVAAQETQNKKEYYKWFDSKLGEGNSVLFNGINFKEEYRTEDGTHRFFTKNDFSLSEILYDNQKFYDVTAKYDIYDDQIIVKLPSQSGFNIIKLIKAKIISFNIFGKTFFNLPITDSKNNKEATYSFAEKLISNNSTSLYKKYFKVRKEKVGRDNMKYSSFKNKNHYILEHENKFHIINSKKDLLEIFPDKKKEIKNFYNKNNSLKKLKYDLFLSNLVKSIL